LRRRGLHEASLPGKDAILRPAGRREGAISRLPLETCQGTA
jgi:hypothetical protein